MGVSAMTTAVRRNPVDVVVAELQQMAVAIILIAGTRRLAAPIYQIEVKAGRVAAPLLGACKRSENCETGKEQDRGQDDLGGFFVDERMRQVGFSKHERRHTRFLFSTVIRDETLSPDRLDCRFCHACPELSTQPSLLRSTAAMKRTP